MIKVLQNQDIHGTFEFELQLPKQFSQQTCQLSSLAIVSTTQRATLAKKMEFTALTTVEQI